MIFFFFQFLASLGFTVLTQILGLAILGTTNVSNAVLTHILGLTILDTTNISYNVNKTDPWFGSCRYHQSNLPLTQILGLAIQYYTVQINFHPVDVNKYRYIQTPIGLLNF